MKSNVLHKTKKITIVKYKKLIQRLRKATKNRSFRLRSSKRQNTLLSRIIRYERRLHRLGISVSLGLPLLYITNRLDAQTPVGTEFIINTFVEGFQASLSMAMDEEGNFVVVWTSEYQDGNEYGIYAQRYNSEGVRIGTEFQINTQEIYDVSFADVAMDDDGDFVAVWRNGNEYGDSLAIYGQRFDSLGEKVGVEFQINSTPITYVEVPAIAMDSDGDFVVVWTDSDYSNYSNSEVAKYAQSFNADGTPRGAEILVSDDMIVEGYYYSDRSSVAMDSEGNFAIVWIGIEQGYSYYGNERSAIYAKCYSKEGIIVKDQFAIINDALSYQAQVSIAMDDDGDFVVIWSNYTEEEEIYSINGRRYDVLGNPKEEAFQVNTSTLEYQRFPNVAMDAEGNFVVVWDNYAYTYEEEEQDAEIYAQVYSANGDRVGAELIVNTNRENVQLVPSVQLEDSGNFVVIWNSYEEYGNFFDVYGQRYQTTFSPSIEVKSSSDWSVYPNPTASDEIQIDFKQWIPKGELWIYDMLGQVMYHEKIQQLQEKRIPLNNMPKGIFNIVVETNGQIVSEQIVIE